MSYATSSRSNMHLSTIHTCTYGTPNVIIRSLDSLFRMNYDEVTREYKAPCTVWKAAQMMNFEDVLEQYEPMISASIRKLNIYRDHESFRQAGRIALWQAWNRFDEAKGNFTPFAYQKHSRCHVG